MAHQVPKLLAKELVLGIVNDLDVINKGYQKPTAQNHTCSCVVTYPIFFKITATQVVDILPKRPKIWKIPGCSESWFHTHVTRNVDVGTVQSLDTSVFGEDTPFEVEQLVVLGVTEN